MKEPKHVQTAISKLRKLILSQMLLLITFFLLDPHHTRKRRRRPPNSPGCGKLISLPHSLLRIGIIILYLQRNNLDKHATMENHQKLAGWSPRKEKGSQSCVIIISLLYVNFLSLLPLCQLHNVKCIQLDSFIFINTNIVYPPDVCESIPVLRPVLR